MAGFNDVKQDILDSVVPTDDPTLGKFGEATYAEVAVLALFWSYFRNRYGEGSIVFADVEYKNLKVTGSSAASFILEVMDTDFRNMLSQKALKKNPKTKNEGKNRKLDMMGISPDGRTVEILEVSTESGFYGTVTELDGKLETLRKDVTEMIHKREVEKGLSLIGDIDWKPSPFKPPRDLVVPTTGLINSSPEIRWICYRPSYRLQGKQPVPDGIVLYEVHSLNMNVPVPVQIPEPIRKRLRLRFEQNDFDPLPVPWESRYVVEHPSDAQALQELAKVAGVLALIALLVGIFIATDGAALFATIPTIGEAGAAGTLGIDTVATAPRALITAMRLAGAAGM